MATTGSGDRMLITFRGSYFEQEVLNTFVYRCNAVTGTPNQTDVITALHTKITGLTELVPTFLACTPPQYSMVEIWYQTFWPLRYAKQVRNTGLGAGTLPGGVGRVPNMAAVILRRGDLANRRNVSTLHVPIGQSADEIAGGFIGAVLEGQLNLLAAKMLTTINTVGTVSAWEPVIHNGPGAADYTLITDTQVKLTARDMRRRTVGLGE